MEQFGERIRYKLFRSTIAVLVVDGLDASATRYIVFGSCEFEGRVVR